MSRPAGRGDAALHGMFQRFFHSEVSGSVVLLACTVAALVLANSPWADGYFRLLHTKAGVSWAGAPFALTLHHWVNDGLMVLFFFVVGLEIKRELVVGQLSSAKRAVLPVAAALGGMLVPAGIYAALNAGGPGRAGWGVPMATDIAFALGVLALFGARAPIGLKVFLTALAIADDLGAVLVIALFYTEQIRVEALAAAAVLLVLLAFAARLRSRPLGVLLPLVLGVWLAVFASGVHATVAGILVALIIPVRARKDPRQGIAALRSGLDELEARDPSHDSVLLDPEQLDSVVDINSTAEQMLPPGIAAERYFHPVQAFLVLPLFALCNAGVPVRGDAAAVLADPVSLGIILGLFAGKQAGIFLFSWAVVRGGWGRLPEGVTWAQIWGAAALGGIGFTMSLFVSELAFYDEGLVDRAKLGILAASVVSGLFGFAILSRTLPKTGR